MKVVQLHEETPKQFLNTTKTHKIAHYGPKNLRKYPKIKSKSNVKIEEHIENESCSTTWVYPKTVFELFPNTKNSPLGPQKVDNDPKIKSKSKVRSERKIEN